MAGTQCIQIGPNHLVVPEDGQADIPLAGEDMTPHMPALHVARPVLFDQALPGIQSGGGGGLRRAQRCEPGKPVRPGDAGDRLRQGGGFSVVQNAQQMVFEGEQLG